MPNYVGFQYDFAIQNTREDICSTEVSYKCMFLDSPYDKLSQYIASSQVVKLYRFFELWSRLEMFEFDLEQIHVKKRREYANTFQYPRPPI